MNYLVHFVLWRIYWRGRFWCKELLRKYYVNLYTNLYVSLSLINLLHFYLRVKSISHCQCHHFFHFKSHMPFIDNSNNSLKTCFQPDVVVCSNCINKMNLLHRRLGHPNNQSLLHLLKCNQIDNFSANMLKQAP